MDREPSAHSMTAETKPETEVDLLNQKVFLLEQWKAEAVKIISHAVGERNDARGERNDARGALFDARKEIAQLGTEVGRLTAQRNEIQHQLTICREDLATADRTVRVTKAALDAAIEAV